MDGSEGRLGFGGQDEAPAGAPPRSLGETGGWDPDHIETVSFERTMKKPDDDQGRSYAGLMTAEDHRKRREQLAEQAFTQQEKEADPAAFRRKRAQEAIRQDESFAEAEAKAREERLAAKRAKLAAELDGGGATARDEDGEEGAGGPALTKPAKGGKDKKKKKKKKAKVKSSLLSFGDGEDDG